MQNVGAAQPIVNRPRRRRLKNLIIRPAFQWKYVVTSMLAVFLVTMVIGMCLFNVLNTQTRGRLLYEPTTTGGDIALVLVLFALTVGAVSALAFGLWIAVVTHRIGGPLFVMEGQLSRLIEGRYPQRRSLRKKDEFRDFYEMFWRAVETLKARRKKDLRTLTHTLALARSATDGRQESQRKALEEIIEQIEALCEEAAAELDEEFASEGRAPVAARESASRDIEPVPV